MPNSLHSPGFIVTGPVLSRFRIGVPGGIGGSVNSPTSPELLIVPPSSVMNSDTGLPSFRKLIDSVYSTPSTKNVVGSADETIVTRSVQPSPGGVGYGQVAGGVGLFGVSS